MLSKYPVMHLLKVDDKLAFGQSILTVTGFQMREEIIVVEAKMETKGDLKGPYAIGKLEQFDIQTTPGRMFKSNFKGHDRGLVTV